MGRCPISYSHLHFGWATNKLPLPILLQIQEKLKRGSESCDLLYGSKVVDLRITSLFGAILNQKKQAQLIAAPVHNILPFSYYLLITTRWTLL